MNEQDALDQLCAAVLRLKRHGCDCAYIVDCVESTYADQQMSELYENSRAAGTLAKKEN